MQNEYYPEVCKNEYLSDVSDSLGLILAVAVAQLRILFALDRQGTFPRIGCLLLADNEGRIPDFCIVEFETRWQSIRNIILPH